MWKQLKKRSVRFYVNLWEMGYSLDSCYWLCIPPHTKPIRSFLRRRGILKPTSASTNRRRRSRAEVSRKGRKMCWNNCYQPNGKCPLEPPLTVMGKLSSLNKQGTKSVLRALCSVLTISFCDWFTASNQDSRQFIYFLHHINLLKEINFRS